MTKQKMFVQSRFAGDNCVIAEPVQDLYKHIVDYFGERGHHAIVAGSCATAQALLNEHGVSTDFSDIDIFGSDTTLTLDDVYEIMADFEAKTGLNPLVTLPRHGQESTRRNDLYDHVKITLCANIQLRNPNTDVHRIGVPVQLIMVDLNHNRDPQHSIGPFWRDILAGFDISVSKVALLNPGDTTDVSYLSDSVRRDIVNRTMEFDLRGLDVERSFIRIKKYLARNWMLTRIRLGRDKVMAFENARLHSGGGQTELLDVLFTSLVYNPQCLANYVRSREVPFMSETPAGATTAVSATKGGNQCSGSVFHPLVEQLYGFLCRVIRREGRDIVLAGSSALSQKIMTDSGSFMKYNDVDLFCNCEYLTEDCAKDLIAMFQRESGCPARVARVANSRQKRKRGPEDEYSHTVKQIRMVLDIELRERTENHSLNVQLILLDKVATKIRPFWKTVLLGFDISVCRCAVIDPSDMTDVTCLSETTHNDILHRKMEYSIKPHKAQSSAVPRITKYTSRGFTLDRIELDGNTIWIENVRFITGGTPEGGNLISFLYGRLKNDGRWKAKNARRLVSNVGTQKTEFIGFPGGDSVSADDASAEHLL